ncbi:AI-2E family transporter [Cytophaga aurantiaca]|uniref:AI-2E family transporter n=1 Tax=Cytophaga aurantiaca TaxID=29530 RepID=UPI000525B609|nr:AI-2E family transporter [Cytophaga aurantiaca]
MNNQSPAHSFYDTTIRMIFLLIIIVWCLLILNPFANVLLWSLILALAMLPLHRFLSKKLGEKPKLASFILVFSFLLLVIIPLFVVVTSLVEEVMQLKATYVTDPLTIPAPDEKIKSLPVIGKKLYTNWLAISTDKDAFVQSHQEQLIEFGKVFMKGILGAVSSIIQLILSLCIAGVLLAYDDTGKWLREFFIKIAGSRGDEFADLTVKIVSSVVKGVLGEGFVLALLHGVVFMLAGVPYPGILTLVVFVFAIVQVPAFFVSIPVVIYFFVTKETMPAVMWSVLMILVSLSDNILTPLMLGKGAPVPMVVIFIGVIGGFVLSGFIGLFTGAIVMSLGYKLFLEWIRPGNTLVKE